VHFGVLLRYLPSLQPRPNHKGVHWPFDVFHLHFLPRRTKWTAESDSHWTDTGATWWRRSRHALHATQSLGEGPVAHIAAGSVIKDSYQLVTLVDPVSPGSRADPRRSKYSLNIGRLLIAVTEPRTSPKGAFSLIRAPSDTRV